MTGSTLEQANKTKRATDPNANIAVFASAGSGKTYLLVHRILKLLLNGVEPAHILAITFTRKAAAEMQERLMKVLAEWASVDDAYLQKTLKDLSHPYDSASIAKARNIYEELLFAEHEIRITTFHAFCQDILKRFAIHAGVPAGFHVVESNSLLKQEARKQLFKRAQSEDQQNLSQSLFKLLDHCNSVNNIHQVLDTFIDSRSDWWSFTESQKDPVAHAEKCLYSYLFKQPFDYAEFISFLKPLVHEYNAYLSFHSTKTNQKNCETLSIFLEDSQAEIQHHDAIIKVYLTEKLEKRKLKASKKLEKNLGSEKMNRLLQLHDIICEHLLDYIDNKKKQDLYEFNQAWFYAGHQLIEEYQQLKFNQHALDFDDLEWYTYLLLNQQESATWVQFKLDQRIQHILIDEFQDTNPTQWKLILPLLKELALDSNDNHRSLFFVGDAKQSIYGFRRANSYLQDVAADWAKQNLKANVLETDDSYRSSPVIIKFVNQVFAQKNIQLKNFNAHKAVQSNLWGEIQIEPLATIGDLELYETPQLHFRNPLLQARQNIENDSHFLEGQTIAKKINSLINSSNTIASEAGAKTIDYNDIMILARSRTHLAQLELALREQNIPYNSTYDKDFLSKLEVQDILALLTFLIQPHNDLALAQVLRSPLYALSDNEMMQISIQAAVTWHEKLKVYVDVSNNQSVKIALEQLHRWQTMVNTIPVHDLLDQIYFQTNLLARYASSCSSTNNQEAKAQVLENLIALLQLSLDLDAGRYSNVQSFLETLKNPNAIDSVVNNFQQQYENAIQIMTIHAAKGLEAPVVFLMDTGSQKPKSHTYQPIIHWPSEARRPEQFFILARKNDVDKNTQIMIDQQIQKDWQEELNLLYVALTRAKQYLFISGTASKQNTYAWHSIINDAFEQDINEKGLNLRYGKMPQPTTPQATSTNIEQTQNIDFDLNQPFAITNDLDLELEETSANEDLANYGTLVHKIFELTDKDYFHEHRKHEQLKTTVDTVLNVKTSLQDFGRALEEVKSCMNSKALNELFLISPSNEILKEVPVSYIKNGQVYYRIIDRLIIEEKTAWIIDYKTASDVKKETMHEHAMRYLNQIDAYRIAVEKLYPNKTIRASILFTSIPALYDFSEKELKL